MVCIVREAQNCHRFRSRRSGPVTAERKSLWRVFAVVVAGGYELPFLVADCRLLVDDGPAPFNQHPNLSRSELGPESLGGLATTGTIENKD